MRTVHELKEKAVGYISALFAGPYLQEQRTALLEIKEHLDRAMARLDEDLNEKGD